MRRVLCFGDRSGRWCIHFLVVDRDADFVAVLREGCFVYYYLLG